MMTTDDTSAASIGGLRLYVMAVALGLLAVGCGEQQPEKTGPPPKQKFKFQVEVKNTNGEVVPEIPLLLDGKVVGYTDKKGKVTGFLEERPGTELELNLDTIRGYRFVKNQTYSEPLEVKPGVEGTPQPVPVMFQAVVESIHESFLVWVKAECDEESLDPKDCRGLSVMRDGTKVAETDRTGRAHFNLSDKPGTKLSVTIETPAPDEEKDIPKMAPANPTYDIELGTGSEVYVIEETFEDPDYDPAPRWKRRSRRTSTSSTSGGSSSGGSTTTTGGSSSGGSGGSGGSSSGGATGGGSGGGSGGGGDSNGNSDTIDIWD